MSAESQHQAHKEINWRSESFDLASLEAVCLNMSSFGMDGTCNFGKLRFGKSVRLRLVGENIAGLEKIISRNNPRTPNPSKQPLWKLLLTLLEKLV